ncbi:MAG TPA: hypothetical protein DCX07_07685 [Phycisphaerales bacterium]|nr:hypothetical protein [Phycisphaerales bacterium]
MPSAGSTRAETEEGAALFTAPAARHPTLGDRLAEHVFEKIVRGELKPAQRITEEQLAADFGASRTPVREAVKRLAELGVVVVHPRARLEVAGADPHELVEINQVREELECLALRLAVPRLTDRDVETLRELADRCERAAEEDRRLDTFRADSRLHLAIAARCGNRCLYETLRRLDVKVQLCRAFACVSPAKVRASVAVHREILEAVARRDAAEAERRMRRHIRATVDSEGESA